MNKNYRSCQYHDDGFCLYERDVFGLSPVMCPAPKRCIREDYEKAKENCREGWVLNPNIKVVLGILRALRRNGGDCPCQNDSMNKECPCSNYREHDKCCCGLYIKK